MAFNGSFTDFEDALRGFESGVNPETIASGYAQTYVTAADWNAYQNSAKTPDDLRHLQYTSVNSLGFVGYQVGEALLIDLDYYYEVAPHYYAPWIDGSDPTNDWQGQFLGKDGITSLATLKTSLQESVMLAEFGLNLNRVESLLQPYGQNIAQFIGTTHVYTDTRTNEQLSVTYSLTGILAAAHLRGAEGLFDLMHNGNVTTDENGTSIITYLNNFGNYQPIDEATLIGAWSNNTTMQLAEQTWHADFNHDGKIGDTPVGGGQTFVGHLGAGSETFTGTAAGIDTVNYSGATAGVTVDLGKSTPQAIGGGEGTDKLISIENLIGSGFADVLTGDVHVNALTGNGGNDILNGKEGADTMTGGAGDDFYYVDNAADRVFESVHGGNDRVYASVSYALAAGQEIETLVTTLPTGTTAINLTGNEFAQTIVANAGANIIDGKGGVDLMYGMGGNDFYYVDNSADRVFESVSGGNDRVYTSVSYALGAGQEIETFVTTLATATTAINLTGNEFAQTITGNGGANTINGKGGIDLMYGLGGNDFYYVDNASDRVFESAGGGNDRVYTSASYTLGAGQEIETFVTTLSTATAAINLTGNEFANTIVANAGANIIDGKAGNDLLYGSGGNDRFVFDTALNASTNVDRIFDFTSSTGAAGNVDKIALDDTVFAALNPTHLSMPFTLSATAFTLAAPLTAGQHIIYNATNGALSYDDDGNGAHAAIQFAILTTHPVLTNADFLVV